MVTSGIGATNEKSLLLHREVGAKASGPQRSKVPAVTKGLVAAAESSSRLESQALLSSGVSASNGIIGNSRSPMAYL